jgi:hypothetical protein
MEKALYLQLPKNADRLTYVRGLLAVHQIKSRSIAKGLGVHETAVSRVLHGSMKSRRIQEAIAGLLNMTYRDVWGEPAQTDSIFNRNRRGRQ